MIAYETNRVLEMRISKTSPEALEVICARVIAVGLLLDGKCQHISISSIPRITERGRIKHVPNKQTSHDDKHRIVRDITSISSVIPKHRQQYHRNNDHPSNHRNEDSLSLSHLRLHKPNFTMGLGSFDRFTIRIQASEVQSREESRSLRWVGKSWIWKRRSGGGSRGRSIEVGAESDEGYWD